MKKIDRQAVVIIHGMGEQRPMDTLRDFVNGVKWQMEQLDPSEKIVKIRSKADSVGDIYETVRLSMESNYKAKRPITDFYEFYWAHNMRGTKISHMWTWLTHIFLKPLRKVPAHLHKIWWTMRCIFILACMISLLFTFFLTIPDLLKPIIALFSGALISFLGGIIASFVKDSFVNSLGDVARYLTPEPENILERSAIRQQGITFLKKLHSIKTRTKPDRIIIVAHSLGSAVAYDLLRLLWSDYGTLYSTAPQTKQDALEKVNFYAKNPDLIEQEYNAFAEAQYGCWQECNDLGNPWLISDFITVGAALNALDYFMVSRLSVEEMIGLRELPVCPPVPDDGKGDIYYRGYLRQDGATRSKGINIPHNAALFALTRWTNIFYTSDFVGGPMKRIFGKGMSDIPIRRKSTWFYPGGHTAYWKGGKKNEALEAIVTALKLSPERDGTASTLQVQDSPA
ncbi:hypothetical protein [Flavobacterium sp.]|uniref:hypothetical protein n=1 Tax=Flavobacterium sp. TaxID=239 RepID=UPI0040348450